MSWALLIVLLVAAQRAAELIVARRNTNRLRQRGAIEHGAGHYPLFIVLHGAWLLACLALASRAPALDWRFLAPFLALQPLRLWVLATLGERWSTRILVLTDARPVNRGPYRWLRHPNYGIVALELPLLPMALGAPWLAALFGLLNLALLSHRIAIEDRALGRRSLAGPVGSA